MIILDEQEQDDFLNENHEINVTPFIDVILVLLIIFMVAAPLSTVTTEIELPASSAEVKNAEQDMIIIVLDKALQLRLNTDPVLVERSQLKNKLDILTGTDTSRILYIQADKQVDYGALMGLFDDLRSAGYLNVSLVGQEKG